MLRKPLIGITVAHCKEELDTFPREYYVESIREGGGIAVLLPSVKNVEEGKELLASVDGLVLSGGGDISPYLMDRPPLRGIGSSIPERDISELILAKEAMKKEIPLLGICRGCQIIAIAGGGEIYQDILTQYNTWLEHSQKAPRSSPWHKVQVQESLLYEIVQTKELGVNSFHHQAVSKLPPGFIVNAIAPDGIIEGIEKKGRHFCLGIQWHPESMRGDIYSQKIFKGLIKACLEK